MQNPLIVPDQDVCRWIQHGWEHQSAARRCQEPDLGNWNSFTQHPCRATSNLQWQNLENLFSKRNIIQLFHIQVWDSQVWSDIQKWGCTISCHSSFCLHLDSASPLPASGTSEINSEPALHISLSWEESLGLRSKSALHKGGNYRSFQCSAALSLGPSIQATKQ